MRMRTYSGSRQCHADHFGAGLTVIGFTFVDDNADDFTFVTMTTIATMTPISAITPMTTAASSPVVRFVSETRIQSLRKELLEHLNVPSDT